MEQMQMLFKYTVMIVHIAYNICSSSSNQMKNHFTSYFSNYFLFVWRYRERKRENNWNNNWNSTNSTHKSRHWPIDILIWRTANRSNSNATYNNAFSVWHIEHYWTIYHQVKSGWICVLFIGNVFTQCSTCPMWLMGIWWAKQKINIYIYISRKHANYQVICNQ